MEENSVETVMVDIKSIKENPDNPRIIKDDKFKKLVKSVKEFPEMLHLRPIVVNAEMMVLGGNMRLKACLSAGYKEVPVIIADRLTEEQQKEFLIKDNVSGGEWDFDLLANGWDCDLLTAWGLDVEIDKDTSGEEIEEIKKEQLPYKKSHILISYPPSLHEQIKTAIEQVVSMDGVEYEQTSN